MTPKTLSIPNSDTIFRTVLNNGITVLVYENHSTQSVVIGGSLLAGAIHETPGQNGLANMTASTVMLGTQTRDFDAIHSSLEDIGADLDVSCGAHKVGFSGKALAEDLPVLVDVLADVLRYPVFPEQQFERRRGESLTWLQYRQQDTRWQAARVFRENLYPEHHPYHFSVRGTLETIPQIKLDDVKAFHRNHYGPRNMIIVVVGAVYAADVVAVIENRLGDWSNPDQPAEPDLPDLMPASKSSRGAVVIPGKTQSDLVMGCLGPSRYAPDYEAARLANSVLGQFGMMGRIGDVVREQAGLAYYASSRMEGGYGPGAWNISAGVNPANIDRALELCQAEIRRIVTEPISDEDLSDNQSYFTGRLPLQLESNEGISSALLSMESYGLGLDHLANYHETVYKITKDDVLQAARRYLNPDALVIAIAGPG